MRFPATEHTPSDKSANDFGVGVSPGHGQTTVKTDFADLFVGLMTIAELEFCGADDGNRTRVFSLGS